LGSAEGERWQVEPRFSPCQSFSAEARPDPLADTAAEINQHMNAHHKDALVLLAREFAGIERVEQLRQKQLEALAIKSKLIY
jgi:hypothetical protein